FLGFRGTPHFVVAVKHPDGAKSWILRATIDSVVFTRLVRSAQLGERGDAYIVDSRGKYQTPPRFGGEVMHDTGLDMARVPRGVNVVERVGPGGKKLLTAFAWLPTTDWLLVIDQNPSEVLGPLNVAREVELAVLVLATLFIAASVLFLVRLMVRRLEAQDAERSAFDAQLAHSGRLVSLGRMAAGVAHEINNPLAAIGELAGLLEDLAAQDENLKQSEHADLFQQNLAKIQGQVERVRDLMPEGDFIEVYCDCSLDTCEKRDVKGLYKKARAGIIKNYTGISSPYEEPEWAEIVVDTDKLSVEESADLIMQYLRDHGYIPAALKR
ncbi:MAG: adenylyl-sulfate kinase, partial [Gammaproteobacteria bacterium]